MNVIMFLSFLRTLARISTFPGATWEKIAPEFVGLNETRLDEEFETLAKFGDIGNVAVIRYGKVCYTKGDVHELIPIYSMGKGLMAIIAGMQISKGNLKLTDTIPMSNDPEAAMEFFNQPSFEGGTSGGPLRTWHEFLSMQSDFGLEIDVENPNIRKCAYNNNAIQLYASFLNHTFYKKPTEIAFLKRALYNTLQLEDGIKFKGQYGGYAGGYRMSALDIARAGHLLAMRGKWLNETLLSPQFVEIMFQPQVSTYTGVNMDKSDNRLWNIDDLSKCLPWNPDGYKRMGGDLGYGYGIWLINENVAHLSGLYGNYVIVDRDKQLVIAVVNHADDHPTAPQYYKAVQNSLKASFLDVF